MIVTVLTKIVVGVLVLGLLIFVHELGHFLFAKYFGVGVLEFAIGFGKKLWSKQIGETRYSIRAIPLGGYVRMVGDDPRLYASGDVDDSSPGFEIQQVGDLSETQKAMINDKSRWLLEKSYWPKFFIIFGGPLFNILFAWFVAIGFYAWYGHAESLDEPRLGELFPDYPAQKSGLRKGDLVLKSNGRLVESWDEFAKSVKASKGDQVTLDILRENKSGKTEELTFIVKPQIQAKEEALLGGNEEPAFVIGVVPSLRYISVGLVDATLLGLRHTFNVGVMTLKGLYWMVSGKVSADNISGPISIVNTVGTAASSGPESLMALIIFLSVNLAILNLLPIPVLDGGHIFLMTIAAVLRRPLDTKIQDYATAVGLFLLLGLMIFAVGNDLYRLAN